MIVIVFLITFCTTVLLAYLFLFRSRFFSRKNAVIGVPVDVIAEDLSDLTNWQSWLPWLIYEPKAHVDYEYLN